MSDDTNNEGLTPFRDPKEKKEKPPENPAGISEEALYVSVPNGDGTMINVHAETGLTEAEHACMMHLVNAWNAFSSLPVEHPEDQAEVSAALHVIQGVLAHRIARRGYPRAWVRMVPVQPQARVLDASKLPAGLRRELGLK